MLRETGFMEDPMENVVPPYTQLSRRSRQHSIPLGGGDPRGFRVELSAASVARVRLRLACTWAPSTQASEMTKVLLRRLLGPPSNRDSSTRQSSLNAALAIGQADGSRLGYRTDVLVSVAEGERRTPSIPPVSTV